MYWWLKKVFQKITEHAPTSFYTIQSYIYIHGGLEACSGRLRLFLMTDAHWVRAKAWQSVERHSPKIIPHSQSIHSQSGLGGNTAECFSSYSTWSKHICGDKRWNKRDHVFSRVVKSAAAPRGNAVTECGRSITLIHCIYSNSNGLAPNLSLMSTNYWIHFMHPQNEKNTFSFFYFGDRPGDKSFPQGWIKWEEKAVREVCTWKHCRVIYTLESTRRDMGW